MKEWISGFLIWGIGYSLALRVFVLIGAIVYLMPLYSLRIPSFYLSTSRKPLNAIFFALALLTVGLAIILARRYSRNRPAFARGGQVGIIVGAVLAVIPFLLEYIK